MGDSLLACRKVQLSMLLCQNVVVSGDHETHHLPRSRLVFVSETCLGFYAVTSNVEVETARAEGYTTRGLPSHYVRRTRQAKSNKLPMPPTEGMFAVLPETQRVRSQYDRMISWGTAVRLYTRSADENMPKHI